MSTKTYTITNYEPITAPTPAPGWTAVYEDIDNGEPIEEVLVGWVLCRVEDRTFIEDQSVPIETKKQPNEVCGLVESEIGIDVPNSSAGFQGYRHTSTSLEDFCETRFPSRAEHVGAQKDKPS